MPPKNPIGIPFIELSEVDSTNNYAMREVQTQMAEHGKTWFAAYQKSGKGQRGKLWEAEHGENIIMSTALEPDGLLIENQFLLSACISLACFDLFNKYANSGTSIKWPNDLYWNDKKAGGILIENVLQGKKWKFSIVGIGININQTFFPDKVQNAVSLKQITNNTYNAVNLSKELCSCLNTRWNDFHVKKGNELLAEYNKHLYKRGEVVKFKKDQETFKAKVVGVNTQGDLLVDHEGLLNLPFGSVSWLLS